MSEGVSPEIVSNSEKGSLVSEKDEECAECANAWKLVNSAAKSTTSLKTNKAKFYRPFPHSFIGSSSKMGSPVCSFKHQLHIF